MRFREQLAGELACPLRWQSSLPPRLCTRANELQPGIMSHTARHSRVLDAAMTPSCAPSTGSRYDSRVHCRVSLHLSMKLVEPPLRMSAGMAIAGREEPGVASRSVVRVRCMQDAWSRQLELRSARVIAEQLATTKQTLRQCSSSPSTAPSSPLSSVLPGGAMTMFS